MLRTIGVTIRSCRRQKGLSQEALADLARIDRSYMSSIERGLRNVSVLNVARIAVALQVPLCDLLQAKSTWPPRESDRMSVAFRGPAERPRLRGHGPHRAEGFDWELGRSLSLG